VRTSVAVLLAGALIAVVLTAGCAGNDTAREDTAEDQTTKQDTTQRTNKETKKERTKVRSKGSEAGPRKARLEMQGSEGTEFSGFCTVGDEEKEISGQVPDRFTFDLDGGRLECEIRNDSSDGNLQIAFNAGNAHSVQQVSGGTTNLTYENGQVSFSSSSTGSSSSVSSSQAASSSSSQSNSSSVNISP
jgi:hypothetical protein